MVEHNKKIHWVPGPVGSKRFGNWLADARDWNVSRNRFWGTPIPVWVCQDCSHEVCLGSMAELEERAGEPITDIHPHRIDHLSIPCERCGGEAKRFPHLHERASSCSHSLSSLDPTHAPAAAHGSPSASRHAFTCRSSRARTARPAVGTADTYPRLAPACTRLVGARAADKVATGLELKPRVTNALDLREANRAVGVRLR